MDVKNKILMFSPIFAPFANPEAIVNNKLALAFIRGGYKIDIITRKVPDMYGYNYGSSWAEPWMDLKDKTFEVDYKIGGKFRQGFEAVRQGLRVGNIIVGCRWAAHASDLAMVLHRENSYDLVLSRSLPEAGHLAAYAFVRKTGLPWIANWNDPHAKKSPAPSGMGVNARLGYFMERYLMNVTTTVDWMTFPSERMKRYMCKYLTGSDESRSTVIPHIAMDPGYDAERPAESEIFSLCHAGNLYPLRNPEVFLEGLSAFINEVSYIDKIRFEMIGLERVEINRLVKKYSLEDNVFFAGPMSYKDTLKHLGGRNVLVVIEAPYDEGIYLPSKFVDYVQAGRPILAVSPRNGTLHDIVSSKGGGVWVDCRSALSVKEGLLELYRSWKEAKLYEQYGSARLFELFSEECVVRMYEEIFNKVV